MKLREALELIFELAQENILDINDPDIKNNEVLFEHAKEQDEALGVVKEHIDFIRRYKKICLTERG